MSVLCERSFERLMRYVACFNSLQTNLQRATVLSDVRERMSSKIAFGRLENIQGSAMLVYLFYFCFLLIRTIIIYIECYIYI